jgi:hypothetical protein
MKHVTMGLAGTQITAGLIASGFILGASVTGCGPTTTAPSVEAAVVEANVRAAGEIELAIGDIVDIPELGLRIGFDALAEDSRCPTHAFILCVWEGNAAVDLALTRPGEESLLLRLNTTLEPGSLELGSVRVTLLEVLPVPYDVDPIPPEDYSVRLLVEPTG